jgi:superfamily II DNA or RNA helicase
MNSLISIKFELGTILMEGWEGELSPELDFVKHDPRTQQLRCRGCDYRSLLTQLYREQREINDQAKKYEELKLSLKVPLQPRPHQTLAFQAWVQNKGAGTVCLPTGAGKTILAVMTIARTQRSTLVVVPTIDLMQQWAAVLSRYFAEKIGLLGGGYHEILPLTVATYDSAYLHIEHLGARFGLLIFDECHHLPAPQYQMIAIAAIAPYRLGLSATLQRTDGKESVIFDLVGPLVYEGDIQEMVGETLAPYDVVTIEVPMTEQEQQQYTKARETYVQFIRQNRLSLSAPGGWQQFLYVASQSPWGRSALRAYREQKQLAQTSAHKIEQLWELLQKHCTERIIIFTDENTLAYKIGRTFLLPVLTHQTKIKERKKMLEAFKDGTLSVLVTSKVLNEGVDVPEASIGIVVSGSGTVREHVQRLGRILRSKPGKRATMYELISAGTSEYYVNLRRKEHRAYQGSAYQ